MVTIVTRTTIVFLATLIPMSLSQSAGSPSVPASNDVALDESGSSPIIAFMKSAPKTSVLTIFRMLKLPFVFLKVIRYILVLILKLLETVITIITSPVTLLLKILSLPVVFILRLVLLIAKILGDIILNLLVYFVLWPLLTILGMGSTITSLKLVLKTLDLLQDNVSCLLSTLSFFGGLLPGCDTSGDMNQKDLSHATNLLDMYSDKVNH